MRESPLHLSGEKHFPKRHFEDDLTLLVMGFYMIDESKESMLIFLMCRLVMSCGIKVQVSMLRFPVNLMTHSAVALMVNHVMGPNPDGPNPEINSEPIGVLGT